MFTPEGPEKEHFVYDVTCKDNLQFVNSKFLRNIKQFKFRFRSVTFYFSAYSQSTENSTVYEPHNYNYDYFDDELNGLSFRIDLEDFLQSLSPGSYQVGELLSQEIESTECEIL